MTENGIPKDSDLKRGLIIATAASLICTTITGVLSLFFWGEFKISVVSVLAMFLILWIFYYVFSTWKYYREGNMQLAEKSRNAMLTISIIPLVGFLFFTIFMLLFVVGRY